MDSYGAFTPLDIADRVIIFPGDLHPAVKAHRRHAEALAEALSDTIATRTTLDE